ncbi:alpha/beta fold hydrolase [candidate division KSB3 bacterium]|uniref:Alpha/beta fold hydrolase n=1 Tax=candidate division KSB3 bacterium TaxID=2044937 RepID=A0A9D5JVA5_9BACT|nr:alpha/beta fold hydrolase [candidate division KSB3 bacterium]MBD3324815.1 alpha/beta fold hydrolase [candidate division KSB3 bacterium]
MHDPRNVRVFCLPFSGGNIYSYRKLEDHTAECIDLVPLELPGHGKRLGAPLLVELEAMVKDIFQQIVPAMQAPYALYGHSLGGILGYLVSQKLAKADKPLPVHLFVSGRQGPPIPSKDRDLHLLPQEEFIRRVVAYGGIPPEVAAEKDLMELFVPILKADFQAIAAYTYRPEPPLNLPITVMIGADEDITYAEALRWQDVTTQRIVVRQFPGNHFFIFDHLPEIGGIISQALSRSIT